MNINPLVIAIGGIALLGGCTPNDIHLGSAVEHNKAMHIINPDPQYDGPATQEGVAAAAAVERYATDKVKQPKAVRTTQSVQGQNSGGGGGSPQ